MSEWKNISLGNLYDIRSGLSKPASDFGSGYDFLSFKDVFYNYFIPDELTQLVNSTDKEREACSIRRGDVFLTRTSETQDELGMSSVALKNYENATFNGFSKRLRPKAAEMDILPEYAGYFFRSSLFRRQVTAMSSLSTRASLNNEMLERIIITVPPKNEQLRIGSSLKSLDDKIENNRRMNEALEWIAQAIFKSWFVDFEPVKAKIAVSESGGSVEDALIATMQIISGMSAENLDTLRTQNQSAYADLKSIAEAFPSTLTNSPLGPIPEGWKCSEIGSEIDAVGGGTPSTKEVEFWDNGTVHWTTPKDMSDLRDKVLIDTERKITVAGLKKISSGLLPVDTVLMSSRAPVGYLAIAKIPVAINQGYIAMKCNKLLTPEFVIQWCFHNMEEIKQRASGTTFAEISKKSFYPIPVIVPGNEVLRAYTNNVQSLYSKIEANVRENQSLTLIRDNLLPKLLSGEISVEDTESAEG